MSRWLRCSCWGAGEGRHALAEAHPLQEKQDTGVHGGFTGVHGGLPRECDLLREPPCSPREPPCQASVVALVDDWTATRRNR